MRTDSEIKALAEEFYEEKLNEWLDPDTDNNVKNFWVDAMIDFHNSLPNASTERVECYLPCGFSESEIYAGTEAGPLPLKLVTLTVVPNHQNNSL